MENDFLQIDEKLTFLSLRRSLVSIQLNLENLEGFKIHQRPQEIDNLLGIQIWAPGSLLETETAKAAGM